MRRANVVQTLCDLLGFARVSAARLGGSGSAELQVQATEDDATAKWSELWGHAPLLYRPPADAECLFVELGDEQVVFATKDRRWQIETGEGEVVLRALGSGAAYLRLTPDGVCEVLADDIRLGKNALHKVALDVLVEKAITEAILNHSHATVGGPGAYTPPFVAPPAVGANKVKAE